MDTNFKTLTATEQRGVIAALQLDQLSKAAGGQSLEILANDPNGAAAMLVKTPELKTLTIDITNGQVGAQNAVLFDNYDITGMAEGTVTKTVSGGLTYSDVMEIIAVNNLLIVGFRLQVPASIDFSKTCLFKRVNLDGTVDEQYNVTQIIKKAQNPNYLAQTFVFVNFVRVIDAFCGLSLQVAPGVTSIDFYVAKQDRNS